MKIRKSMLAASIAAISLAGAATGATQSMMAAPVVKATPQQSAALVAALLAPHATEGLDGDHGYVLAREHPGQAGTKISRLHHTFKGVRVLGSGNTGTGDLILAGLEYAIEQGFNVVNMSLSTTRRRFAELLHELADDAYFQNTVLVASAHNMPVESYPWRFSSVISVGSHEGTDSWEWYANPTPPVEFFARGVDIDVAWFGGSTLCCTGNSFAAPHIAGLSALVLSKHPGLTPFQLKSVLYLTASNTGGTE